MDEACPSHFFGSRAHRTVRVACRQSDGLQLGSSTTKTKQDSQQVGLGADTDARTQPQHERRSLKQAQGTEFLFAKRGTVEILPVGGMAPPPPITGVGSGAGKVGYLLAYGWRKVPGEGIQALHAEQRGANAGPPCEEVVQSPLAVPNRQ
jgi:hypothetical protein